MKFLFTGIFFGTLLVLWGVSLIVEAIFGISIPIMRVGFALLLMYAGLTLIKGMYEAKNQKAIFFSQESVKADANNPAQYYKIVFGQGTVDLSDIDASTAPIRVQVYTLFGKGILKLNPQVSTVVNATSVLSSVSFPDKTLVSLGNYRYMSGDANHEPQVVIDATAVFSALEIRNS